MVKRKSVKHDKKLFLRQSEKVYGGSDAAHLEAEMEAEMETEIETEAGTQQGISKGITKEDLVLFALSQILSKPHTSQLTRNSTSMSVPASSAQIPTGHAHSVNRSGGVIALSHSDFSPNTRKREVVRENGLDSGRRSLYIGSGKAASVFVLTPRQA
ncbi:hypothetical protein BD560DRAFT_419266 [Blakeslea trispora]|nr:hypothetical protein BD560DRAFT_419266 [Blakeslea trispora]